MPTTRRQRKAAVREKLTPARWAYLSDCVDLDVADKDVHYFWDLFEIDDRISQRLWAQYQEDVLNIWIPQFLGTRPRCWWLHSAPREPIGRWPGYFFDGKLSAPRCQVAGPGKPAWDAGASIVPCFQYGLPECWDREIDSSNPPIFESQPQYLRRHRLLTSLELQRLQPADFEPKPIFDLPCNYQTAIWRRSQKEQLNNQLQNELDSHSEKGKVKDGIAEEIQERA
jgi:hypothetical protein